jgi:hypothetical protein
MNETEFSARPMTTAEIVQEARRLQGEAVARFVARTWNWLRTSLRPSGTSAPGIAARLR